MPGAVNVAFGGAARWSISDVTWTASLTMIRVDTLKYSRACRTAGGVLRHVKSAGVGEVGSGPPSPPEPCSASRPRLAAYPPFTPTATPQSAPLLPARLGIGCFVIRLSVPPPVPVTVRNRVSQLQQQISIGGGNGGSICAHGRPRPLRRVWRGAHEPAATLHTYEHGNWRGGAWWTDGATVQACDPQNFEPNLALNLEITDLINQKKGSAYASTVTL